MRVLVIDDERKTSSYLKTGLSEQGFVVDVARNGEDGLHLAAHGEYDLVIIADVPDDASMSAIAMAIAAG